MVLSLMSKPRDPSDRPRLVDKDNVEPGEGQIRYSSREVDRRYSLWFSPILGWLVDRKIAPHIPVIDKAEQADGT